MAVCNSCGKELPGEFPFCPSCGAPLAETAPPPAHEERKVVSVLSLLGQGRCLAALGKPEAVEPLREARELFRSMGYRPALEECDALLGQAAAAAR